MSKRATPLTPEENRLLYDDTADLIEDALVLLAQRRAAYLGDDLAALKLIVSLIQDF